MLSIVCKYGVLYMVDCFMLLKTNITLFIISGSGVAGIQWEGIVPQGRGSVWYEGVRQGKRWLPAGCSAVSRQQGCQGPGMMQCVLTDQSFQSGLFFPIMTCLLQIIKKRTFRELNEFAFQTVETHFAVRSGMTKRFACCETTGLINYYFVAEPLALYLYCHAYINRLEQSHWLLGHRCSASTPLEYPPIAFDFRSFYWHNRNITIFTAVSISVE